MKKRVMYAFLWFYSFWCLGTMIAFVFGLGPALGPILGVAAAALMAGDPRRVIWTTRNGSQPEPA
jgi:hypothetical protein